MDREVRPKRIVLVEGVSDRTAVETLAARFGRDLAADGVEVIPMGGATNIRHFVDRFGPQGMDVPLAGLCDVGEERDFRRALQRAGLGAAVDRAGLERLGFFVCVADLEDELIRSVGTAAMDVVAAQGELGSFRTFAKQPAHRSEARDEQLHRFLGTRSGRKNQYARALTEALDLSRVPVPLQALLAHVLRPAYVDSSMSECVGLGSWSRWSCSWCGTAADQSLCVSCSKSCSETAPSLTPRS
jgi:hypothetical protein